VGELIGDPGELGQAGGSELGYLERLPLDQLLALRAQVERGKR